MDFRGSTSSFSGDPTSSPRRSCRARAASPSSIPGPTTCLGTLEQGLQAHGIRWEDVRHLLLTHIHLDHAGAAGTIVREHPHITVLVHERGAKHMIDPSRLLDSATRVYGNDMDRLWGEFASVPQTKIVVVVRRGEGRRRRADVRCRLHAGPRVASRELLRCVDRRRVRRRCRGRLRLRRLCAAADAAARHRSRAVAHERGPDSGVVAVNTLPDATSVR